MRRIDTNSRAFEMSVRTLAIWVIALSCAASGVQAVAGPDDDQHALRSFAGRPLTFVENRGQWESEARYVARRAGVTAAFEDGGLSLHVTRRDGDLRRGVLVRLTFEGSSSAARPIGEKRQRGTWNFFRGSDSDRWQAAVPGFASVLYRGVYDGVDVRCRDREDGLEYDLLLAPTAGLDDVVLHCEGIENLEIADDGSLALQTALGDILQPPPTTWQETATGEKRPVTCRYRRIDDRRFGFEVDGLEAGLSLVIDPGLLWSTLLGGTGDEYANTICRATNGVVTVSGSTPTADFPSTAGAYDEDWNGDHDVYVCQLDPRLEGEDQLVYATFIGGGLWDHPFGLRVDETGTQVAVAGSTYSAEYPTTPDVYDDSFNGKRDGFLTVLDLTRAGTDQLVYSTFLGGASHEGSNIYPGTTEPAGIFTIIGQTWSDDFPTTPGAYDETFNGELDCYVARLDLSRSGTDQLVYSTFLGSSGKEYTAREAMNAAGDVFVVGWTEGADFPTTPGAFDETFNGGSDDPWDGHVSWLRLAGGGSSDLVYSTFVGGTADDGFNGCAVALDGSNELTVVGTTGSTDFPTTPGAYDETFNSGSDGEPYDAVVLRLRMEGRGLDDLVYSSFLGGALWDGFHAVVLDAEGVATISGYSDASDYPTTPGAYDRTHNGAEDVVVTRLALNGEGEDDLVYSTFLGGSAKDLPGWHYPPVVDDGFHPIVTGETDSPDFPTTDDAYDRTLNGRDSFVTRIAIASSWNYGEGYPGTGGRIPALTSNRPQLCAPIRVDVENSYGQPTVGVLLIGLRDASFSTGRGPTLLVEPFLVVAFDLPTVGTSLSGTACDDLLYGVSVYLQALELDPGAARGMSATPGLRLNLGG